MTCLSAGLCRTFAPSSLSWLLPPLLLGAADTDDSNRPQRRAQDGRPKPRCWPLRSNLVYSSFRSRVSDSVTSLSAGCRRYSRRRPRCRVLVVALAHLPQVQRCTGRPYLEATSALAACARKTSTNPTSPSNVPNRPFNIAIAIVGFSLLLCLALRILYSDHYQHDLGLDLSQHPLTRPVAAALAPSQGAALGTAPSCSIMSSPVAWNIYETSAILNPSLYRPNGDAMVRHGWLTTLPLASQPRISRN